MSIPSDGEKDQMSSDVEKTLVASNEVVDSDWPRRLLGNGRLVV